MKVLVIDDSAIHQATAKAQLQQYDTTVVGTYEKAQELLTPQVNYRRAEAILESQFGNFKPWDTKDEAKKQEYYAAEKVAREQATRYPDFDVVLTDLLMPASSQSCRSSPLAGTEMPVGIFLALLAANNGAKYVAVFTDSDHHSHPASACFDAFNSRGEDNPVPFTVGGAKVVLCNDRGLVKYFYPENPGRGVHANEMGSDEYDAVEKGLRLGVVRSKDWRGLLDYLMAT